MLNALHEKPPAVILLIDVIVIVYVSFLQEDNNEY